MDTVKPTPVATPVVDLYRAMWQHAAGARGKLAAALGLQGGSQVVKLALPFMAAQAINTIQSRGREGLLAAGLWIAAALGLHVLSWLLHGPARVLERTVALRVRQSVSDALYTRLVRAPLPWHQLHHSGDLQHRVGQASRALGGFTQTQFIYMANVFQLVGPVLALWWVSKLTGVLAVVGFALVAASVLRFDRVLMRLAGQEIDAERRYSARLLDFVGNISALASLRLQPATRTLLDRQLQKVFAPLGHSIVITEWKWCTVDLLSVSLSWGLVVAYALASLNTGAGAAAGGTLMIGSLFMVYQYAQQAAGVLGSMAAHYQGLVRTQADHASAAPIEAAPCAEPAAPVAADWQRLSLHGMTYRPGVADDGTPRGGIDGVSLEIRRGERLALVGPSGSGKSTLLRVIAGLYPAQLGTLRVDGVPGPAHAGAVATLVPQEAEIFEASLRENLDFGVPVAPAELQRALTTSAFDEVLAGLPQGLDTPMVERGANLSGGQRQRLALARGLLAARHSSLLLLDEPTSALDPLIEEHVQGAIERAFAGQAIVASVHRLSLLPHFDRVAFMVGGRLVDVGTADELRARQPMFAAMCRGAEAVAEA
jgi:ATP-binding cassette, subfamily B, bacterial